MTGKSVQVILFIFCLIPGLLLKAEAKSPEIFVKLKDRSFSKNASQNPAFLKPLQNQNLIQDSRPFFLHQKQDQTPYLEIIAKDSLAARELLLQLSNLPEVLWAEENTALRIHHLPTDSLYHQQWHLPAIGAEMAWQMEKGEPSVVIGVIDTGVDYTHPDLMTQMWVNTAEDLNGNGQLDDGDANGIDDDGNGFVDDVIGWDFTDAPNFPDAGDYLDEDNDPMDEYPGGHGTPVAGVIAAAENGLGVVGVAPGVKVMPLRAGTANGFLEEDDVARAIIYGVDNGCKIINMSFGDVVFSNLIHDAVIYGAQKGVIFVCSSGNSGNNITQYPAGYDETISVGSVNSQISLSPFSSFGLKLNLVAPGQGIYSTAKGGDYGIYNGTSFSAPVVSGVLGLLASQDLSASPARLISRLNDGVQDLGGMGWDIYFGAGLVNAGKSLALPTGSLVSISSPASQSGVLPGLLPVVGTAVSPDFKRFQLSYGAGANPLQFLVIKESDMQVYQDTLAWWDTSALPDSLYTLKLELETISGQSFTHHSQLLVDHTSPTMDSLQVLQMWKAGKRGVFIEVQTDDVTRIQLVYKGESGLNWKSQYSGYPQISHAFFLEETEVSGNIEFYFIAENLAGMQSELKKNNGELFLTYLPVSSQVTSEVGGQYEEPTFGYWMEKQTDLDGDGEPEIWGYIATPAHPEPALGYVEPEGQQLSVFLGAFPAFPRSLADVNQDGLPELLAGYGAESYIIEGHELTQLNQPPEKVPLNDFWGAEMTDLQGDGKTDLIALHENKWQIFEISELAPLQVNQRQVLQNNSSGANEYSVPRILVFNGDADPAKEIIFGDSDGDLLLFDFDGSQYTVVAQIKLEGSDATHRYTIGDFDGNGLKEVAVLTQKISPYLGETGIPRNYWILQILAVDEQLQFIPKQPIRFFGLTDEKGTFSGVSAGDLNGDSKDELFVSVYPRVYCFALAGDEPKLLWGQDAVNANVVPVMPGGRFLLPTQNGAAVYTYNGNASRLQAPAQIVLDELSDTVAVIRWEENLFATHYRILRRVENNANVDTIINHQAFYVDSALVAGKKVTYRFQAADSSGEFLNSPFSGQLSIIPELPPVFEGLTPLSRKQLLVSFSQPLGKKSLTHSYFRISDGAIPSSVLLSDGSKKLLLTFPGDFSVGGGQLTMANLYSWQNAKFLKDSLTIPFEIIMETARPYLTDVKFISRTRLELRFSQPMEKSSTENVANYSLEPYVEILSAELDANDPRLVHLTVSGKNRMGSLGSAYYLTVQNLKDQYGNTIDGQLGNRVRVFRELQNLDEVLVFPNPLRPEHAEKKITFGNVPKGSEIFVFTANGRRVARLEENDGDGGVEWDLTNSEGEPVKSGVYIYLIKRENETKKGKFVIIR
ncbi:MAG: hypothetical protein Kow0037_08110 [Calditrichia bacterium]